MLTFPHLSFNNIITNHWEAGWYEISWDAEVPLKVMYAGGLTFWKFFQIIKVFFEKR